MGLAPAARRRLSAGLVLTALLSGSGLLALDVASAAPAVRGQAAASVKATSSNTFDPVEVTIAAGGTVTWTAEGFHTVTGGTPSSPDRSKLNGPAGFTTYSMKFDEPGSYDYFCEPHAPGMVGKVVVTAGAAGGGSPTTPPTSPTASAVPAPIGSPAPAQSSTASPAQGGQGVEDDEHVPGIDDNPVLAEIEAEEAANNRQIRGFQTLLWGILLAVLALSVALFFSTRPRRAGR